MSENFDTLIIEAEAQVEGLKKEMEQFKHEFKMHLIPFVQQWYKDFARNTVSDEPNLVKELGVEKLREIKDEVNELIEDVPNLVDSYMDNNELWWHLRKDRRPKLERRKISDEIDKEIRSLLMDIAILLHKYGFMEANGGALSHEFQHGSGSYAKPIYPLGVQYSNELEDTHSNYITRVDRTVAALHRIEKLKEEKEVQNAGDLWDSL